MTEIATTEIATTETAAEVGRLALVFARLSLLAIGGVASTLPEMQRQVVDTYGWMSAAEFAALFALAQAAPGPNMLVSTLVGWRVAGWPGALAATLALIGPSGVLTWATARAWHRLRHAPWRRHLQAGLTPVAVGLVMAGAASIAVGTTHGWATGAITAATAGLVLGTRLHPLVPLAAGALLGALGAV